jgi:hypothetical protein
MGVSDRPCYAPPLAAGGPPATAGSGCICGPKRARSDAHSRPAVAWPHLGIGPPAAAGGQRPPTSLLPRRGPSGAAIADRGPVGAGRCGSDAFAVRNGPAQWMDALGRIYADPRSLAELRGALERCGAMARPRASSCTWTAVAWSPPALAAVSHRRCRSRAAHAGIGAPSAAGGRGAGHQSCRRGQIWCILAVLRRTLTVPQPSERIAYSIPWL